MLLAIHLYILYTFGLILINRHTSLKSEAKLPDIKKIDKVRLFVVFADPRPANLSVHLEASSGAQTECSFAAFNLLIIF